MALIRSAGPLINSAAPHGAYTERMILLTYLKSKNLKLDTDLNIILLNQQNIYVKYLSIFHDTVKCFNILATSLNVLHNYFDGPTKLFSDLYLTKFFDILAQSFFFCKSWLLKMECITTRYNFISRI